MLQEERFQLRDQMTQSDYQCAWSWGPQRQNSILPSYRSVSEALGVSIVIVCAVWFIFYVATLLLTPFHVPSPGEAGSRLAWVGVGFLYLLHLLALAAFGSYAIEVLSHVPWGSKKPLIAVPYVPYLGWFGIHYMVMGALALQESWRQSLHVYLIFLEGAGLLYCQLRQPALGFIAWTAADAKAYEARSPAAAASATQTVATPNGEDNTYAVPFKAERSDKTFSAIHGMQDIKTNLLEKARHILESGPCGLGEARNGILLHGEPGNGKTVFAQALAGELQIPIIEVTYGPMASQWIGNMPKVLANTFAYARQCAPCVLFIDEIDSFIQSRGNASGPSEDLKITNTLLTEVVKLRQSRVILIAATNYLENLDAAAIREGRFDFKVEITAPDEAARIGLMQTGIRQYAAHLSFHAEDTLSVAKRWHGFSVARLMAVCRALPDVAAAQGAHHMEMPHWMAALRTVQGRKGRLPAQTRSLAELVLDHPTRSALELVANRLKDVARLESLGGTLPTGILLHGPSGTGKTAAVRALALEADWAFLSVSGADLLADRTRLQKLYAEAKDLRPCLIFIDEADDVMRHRQYSGAPEVVNKLLTLMDGVDVRVQDVVWVAATNHPDAIDSALLRAGRFTEKIAFTAPPIDQIPSHVARWLKQRDVSLSPPLDVPWLAQHLLGQTIADIEGCLQHALNSAIGRTTKGARPCLDQPDIEQALRVVLGQRPSEME